jgi:hypothetical protein
MAMLKLKFEMAEKNVTSLSLPTPLAWDGLKLSEP